MPVNCDYKVIEVSMNQSDKQLIKYYIDMGDYPSMIDLIQQIESESYDNGFKLGYNEGYEDGWNNDDFGGYNEGLD